MIASVRWSGVHRLDHVAHLLGDGDPRLRSGDRVVLAHGASATTTYRFSASRRRCPPRSRRTCPCPPALQRPDQGQRPARPCVTHPALSMKWQQIGPNDVQAVAPGAQPAAPTSSSSRPRCAVPRACTFTARAHPRGERRDESRVGGATPGRAALPTPHLHARHGAGSPTSEVNGSFTWAYPNLPTTFSSQWSLGTDNVILRAALETFQSQLNLPVTGEADADDVVGPFDRGRHQPASTPRPTTTSTSTSTGTTTPETLTLYVAGKATFHTLVNTGISVAPTSSVPSRSTRATSTRRCRAPTPTARPTATPASRGSPTSTAATRCTASSARPTASPRASAASRCPSRRRRPSSPTRRSARWSPFAA